MIEEMLDISRESMRQFRTIACPLSVFRTSYAIIYVVIYVTFGILVTSLKHIMAPFWTMGLTSIGVWEIFWTVRIVGWIDV